MWVWILLTLAIIVALYVFVGREHLKKLPFMAGFFAWLEPIEIMLWKKSETIFFSRVMVLFGAVPFILSELEKLNVPGLVDLLPDEWKGYWTLTFAVIGIVSEFNRRYTTKPLEIVAVPDVMPASVKAKIERVETANEVAVEVVKEAKAEGKV